MESFRLSKTEGGFLIDGFPDAKKVVAISGPEANRLAHLALHLLDLGFAADCLQQAEALPAESVVREALWRSAIVHFCKCFSQHEARFQLSFDQIFRGAPPEARMAFDYFKELRNRHIVHDENPYAQSLPGVIIGQDESDKIQKIVCFSALGQTMEAANVVNLRLLVLGAQSWATSQFDQLCVRLTDELQGLPYEELVSRPDLRYQMPTLEDLRGTRGKP